MTGTGKVTRIEDKILYEPNFQLGHVNLMEIYVISPWMKDSRLWWSFTEMYQENKYSQFGDIRSSSSNLRSKWLMKTATFSCENNEIGIFDQRGSYLIYSVQHLRCVLVETKISCEDSIANWARQISVKCVVHRRNVKSSCRTGLAYIFARKNWMN